MTNDEQTICKAIGTVRFLPGSWDKRFANNMAALAVSDPQVELSAGMKEWIYRILYKYRRQLPVVYNRFKDHPHCNQKSKR